MKEEDFTPYRATDANLYARESGVINAARSFQFKEGTEDITKLLIARHLLR